MKRYRQEDVNFPNVNQRMLKDPMGDWVKYEDVQNEVRKMYDEKIITMEKYKTFIKIIAKKD